uniref:Permease n=1 Tax=uncultured bacterium Contig87 TaxID=1393621 RepID=W0FJU7_9BACT|nr:permease [uncultured bacterium Contig87]
MSEVRKAAERLGFRLLCTVIALAAAYWLLPQFWDKLSPFIIAVPLAAVLQPVIAFLQKKLKLKRSVAALIPVLLIVVIVIGLFSWLTAFGIGQVSKMLNSPTDLMTDTINSVRQALNSLLNGVGANISIEAENWLRSSINGLLARITEWGTKAAGSAVTFSVNLATSLPYRIIYVSFLAMALYFIAKDYEDIRSYLPGGKRRKQDSNTTRLTVSAIRSLSGYLRVQLTFALIVFVVSWIYLACFGFQNAWLIALVAGFMEMIPMIGSGLQYILMAIVYFLLGNSPAGFQVLILTAALQLLRRILEPKLMSDNIGITPLESLVGMFVGLRFGGVLGLIGGPVLMSVFVGAIRGGFFTSTSEDIRCITSWFRERWKRKEAVPASDAETEKPPEESGQAEGQEQPVARKRTKKTDKTAE